VIIGAIGVAFVLYIIICITGYNTFGDEVQSDILLNYPRNILTSIARVFVSLLVMCCYPLQQHPARRSIMSIIALYYPSQQDNMESTDKTDLNGIEDSNESQKREDSKENPSSTETVKLCGQYETGISEKDFQNYMVTTIFLVLSLIIALSVKSLGLVLGFVGATGSTMVSYILPGFCYYYIFKEEIKAPKWKLYLSFAQGVLGLILIPVCLTFLFM
jgi:amino acid permease